MLVRNRNLFLIILTSLSIFLSGCFAKQSPEEKIYDILEKIVTLEEPFVEQQESFIKTEQEERDLYDKIIDLGMKEEEKIFTLADEAIDLNEQRIEYAETERESIVKSKEEFQKVIPLIEQLDDSSTKEIAEQLYEVMNKRYEIHESLHEHYIKGTNFDGELYRLLKNPEISLTELEEQIVKINAEYERVIDNNEKFNEYTDKFNELKLSFYEKVGFEIEDKTE